jgi:hypothetical protein
MHVFTLDFIIALVKHGLSPHIWPKYVPNTINLQRFQIKFTWALRYARERNGVRSEKMELERWVQISRKLCNPRWKIRPLFRVRFFSSFQRCNPLVNTTFRSGDIAVLSQEAPNSFLTCPTLRSRKYKKASWIPGFDEGMQMHRHRFGARGVLQ